MDRAAVFRQIPPMDCQTAIDRLTREQAALRALGLKRLSLFGSTARGESAPDADVEAIEASAHEAAGDETRSARLDASLGFLWCMSAQEQRLSYRAAARRFDALVRNQ